MYIFQGAIGPDGPKGDRGQKGVKVLGSFFLPYANRVLICALYRYKNTVELRLNTFSEMQGTVLY